MNSEDIKKLMDNTDSSPMGLEVEFRFDVSKFIRDGLEKINKDSKWLSSKTRLHPGIIDALLDARISPDFKTLAKISWALCRKISFIDSGPISGYNPIFAFLEELENSPEKKHFRESTIKIPKENNNG